MGSMIGYGMLLLGSFCSGIRRGCGGFSCTLATRPSPTAARWLPVRPTRSSSRGQRGSDDAVSSVAVVVHTGKTLGDGLGELRRVLADAGHPKLIWYEVPKSRKAGKAVRNAVKKGAGLVFVWGGDGWCSGGQGVGHVISLRRHYPVRFVRSTAPSRPLSTLGVCSRVNGWSARDVTPLAR